MKDFKLIKLETRYASQSLKEVPRGCWIDKSTGNCGMSYLALTDMNNAVILVPRVSLADNKEAQKDKYPNLFVVKAGVTKTNVVNYINECDMLNKPYKIISTYDSFALGKLDYLLVDESCVFYVDESQYLIEFPLTNPKLNNELHNRLENVVNRVTFFSAHPPKREYLPEYIHKMEAIKYIWKNQIKATPFIIDSRYPYMIVTKILKQLLTTGYFMLGDGLTFKKAIVFVNSVEGIKQIIEPLNSPLNIAYIVGDTVRNDSKLNELAYRLDDCAKLPTITIGTTSMISGVDLYDEETFNIIISTSSKEFTLFDKELDVPQAITRQRLDSNPYNDKFIFILNVKDMEEKIKNLEETYNRDYTVLTKVVDNLNYLKEGGKDTSIGYEKYYGYYLENTDRFIINENLLKAKKYIFQELYKQYEDGYDVINTNKPIKNTIDNSFFKANTYSDYTLLLQEFSKNPSETIKIIKSVHNLDWKPILEYGVENKKILTNYTEAKEFYETRNDYKDIILKVNKTFKTNIFYSLADVKIKLQEIYDKKGLKRKAKTTDLNEFFKVENTTKRDAGKKIKGLILKKII